MAALSYVLRLGLRMRQHLAGAFEQATSINKLEMSWGRKKPQAAPGAVMGSVVGAIIGAGLGYALGCKTGCDPEEDVLAKSSAIIGVGFGFLGGSMFGAAIGASSRSEWWEQVSLEQLRIYGNR